MQARTLGITLIILGIFMMVYTSFKYVTTEKVIDLGSVKISKEKDHLVQWPPIVGLVLLVGGAVVIATGKKGS